MGNRGDLHASDGTLARAWKNKRWISCVLDRDGWTMPMDTPGHYYKLFFHDETVALAAGHRPCGQCRPDALRSFVAAWKDAHGLLQHDRSSLVDIDRALHDARVRERRFRNRAYVSDLPDGTFVWNEELSAQPLLRIRDQLIPWEHRGFGEPFASPRKESEVLVLTPSPIVAVLRAGYQPIQHQFVQQLQKFC